MAILQNCCFCISPRTGAVILGALYLIGSVLPMVASIVILALPDAPGPFFSLLLVVAIVAGISCVFSVILLVGAIKRNPDLLMVWIVFQSVAIILAFFGFVASPFYIVSYSLVSYIIGGIIDLLLSVYFWLCIVSARQHIKEELRNVCPEQLVFKREE